MKNKGVRKNNVYSEPIILPFDVFGDIYAIQDEKGNIIGTGARETCAVVLHMMREQTSRTTYTSSRVETSHTNVRAAIVI
jgi:hypothetical protein